MLSINFSQKLGTELYKEAAYLYDKPALKIALIKTARAVYNGHDPLFSTQLYFQPEQQTRVTAIIKRAADRLKQAERTRNKEAFLKELGRFASKGLKYGKNSVGRGVDRAGSLFLMGEARADAARRMAVRDMFTKIDDATFKGQKSPWWLTTGVFSGGGYLGAQYMAQDIRNQALAAQTPTTVGNNMFK